MTALTGHSLRPGVVTVAPVILLSALSYHPYIPGRQPNLEELAAAVMRSPMRWGLAHVATGVASALLILAFLAIRSFLREAGEDRWSAASVPFIVVGSTLYAMLPAMEFAPLAAIEAGGDAQAAQAAQTALLPWFVPLLVAGASTFGVGVLCLARAVSQSGVLTPGLTRVVVMALVVMAVTRFVPLSAVQFYVHGVAGLAALLPLAHEMWRQPKAHRPAEPRVVPAT